MRFTPDEIIDHLEYIIKEINVIVDSENPYELAKKLSRLSSLLGTGAKCCGNAEFYYQQKKSDPTNQELRTLADEVNKNMHYCINAIQSVMNIAKLDYINSKNQI